MARLLILDDDPVMRTFLKDVFERIGGHEVQEADRVQTALKLVKSRKFELMLIDQRLPDGTAYDFLEAAARIPEADRIPKWLITGEKPLAFDLARWAPAGLKGCLVKPVRLEQLLEISRQCPAQR
jgi:CheY-like chemotaxis protein